MAPEDLITVPMRANNCELGNIRCYFYTDGMCTHPQQRIPTSERCPNKIFLTQQEFDKHARTHDHHMATKVSFAGDIDFDKMLTYIVQSLGSFEIFEAAMELLETEDGDSK
jgi:hypothetical protein